MSFYKCGHGRDLIFIAKKDFVKQMLIYEDWKLTRDIFKDKSQCCRCFYKNLTKNQLKGYDKKVEEFKIWKQKEAKRK